MIKEYVKLDGKVYEVLGRDAQKRKIVRLVPGLKDIPEDKPLGKPKLVEPKEEVKEETEKKPKRKRRS